MKSPLNITYLTFARMPTEKAHGVSIAHMCASFAAQGARVELVVPVRRNRITEDLFSYYGVPKTFSVRAILVPDFVGRGFTHPFFFFIQRLFFVHAARRAGITAGIVYTREPEIAAAFSNTHQAVYEAHRFPRGVSGWLTGRLLRKVSLAVCNSHGTETALRAAGIPRTCVAPNGFDPALFEGSIPSREELGLPDGILALYAGSDAPWKGIEIVREAAKDAAGVKTIIVGGRTMRSADALVEIGQVPPARVPAYLRSADILLLPNTRMSEESERFTSPIKLFEYFAAGKAIIASDLPSIREILGPDDAVFVPAGDVQALSVAIRKLAADMPLREQLAARSRARASLYTWNARARRVFEALPVNPMMRICLFGDFDPSYSRNRVLRKGLQEAGAEVMLCVTREKGWRRMSDLYRSYRALPAHDLLVVGYSDSRSMVPFARSISSVPVVWDAFYSLYDSFVADRALVSKANPKAWWYWLADYMSVHLAHRVLLDTKAHAGYFARTFFASPERFIRVLVGTDDALFNTTGGESSTHTPLIVGFYGKYIPLQGVDVIVRAAHLLSARKDIRFVLLGSGQTHEQARNLAVTLKTENVEFLPRIPYEEMPAFFASLDIALGVFGTTDKVMRVIPNKVYDAMVTGKPIITSDTPAIRELLRHGYDAYLVPRGDPRALAAAIEKLADDESLRLSLGVRALETYRSHATPRVIGEGLLGTLDNAIRPGTRTPHLRIDFWLPHVKVAGGTKVSLTYAELLSRRGHDVRVFSLRPGWQERLFGAATWKGKFRVPLSYVQGWEEACRHESDVIIADSWQVADALLSCNPPKRLFEFVQHDERLYHGQPNMVEAVYRAPNVTKVVVASWLKETFERDFATTPAFVMNTIDREAFYPDASRAREQGMLRVALLVHTYPWKGTQEGIDMLTELKKKYPHIRSIGFGVRTKECPDGIDEYHYDPSPEELRAIYTSSDIFLCPSWDEGFGLPSLEAMACGAALVTYENGGSRDFAFDGETAFVAPHRDRDVLAQKLEAAILDKSLRARIVAHALVFVARLPTLEDQTDALEACLAGGRKNERS